MTTENETQARNLNELLALNTYQGMTDEEIELIVEYRSDMKARALLLDDTRQKVDLARQQKLAAMQQSCQNVGKVLDSIMNRELVLHTVGGDNE